MRLLAFIAAIGAALWLPLAFMEAMALQVEIDQRARPEQAMRR